VNHRPSTPAAPRDAAAPALAAASSATDADVSPESGEWHRVAGSGDVSSARPFGVSLGGRELVLVRAPSGCKAFSGICPHQGGLLAGGDVRRGALVCQNHGWAFDVETGERRGGPGGSSACLRRFEVDERPDGVWVRVPRSPTEESVTPPAPPLPAASLREIDDLPGPRGWPLVGNSLQVDARCRHRTFERWALEFGPLTRVRIAGKQMVLVNDPAIADQVFRQRPQAFRRGTRLEAVLRELETHGVFSAEGDSWRSQRKLVMEALAARNLRAFFPHLLELAGRLLERWRGAAARGDVLDMQQEMMRFTVDVTTWLAFGRDLDAIRRGGDALQGHLETVLAAFPERLFALAPVWRWFPTRGARRVRRALAALHAWVDPQIEEIRALQERDPERREAPRNLLEAMVAARQEDGTAFSNAVLFANALVMLIGGEDTTASTATWAVHELCDVPSAAATLQAEVDAALGELPLADTLERLDRLPYTLAVAHETSRLRPVAPLLLFQANTEQQLGGVRFPAGSTVMLLTRLPGVDPALVEGAQRFEPARWLDGPRAASLQRSGLHVPFGSGPRMCPARNLALIEIRLVLSMLYRNFHVHRVGASELVSESIGFTMMPRGVRVRLESRA
jgi:cytochrome P450/nitrite reductase/ring-hydroxylating ferredoxin subunit